MTLLLEQPRGKSSKTRLSLDEFVALPNSSGYELIAGVLTERKEMGVLSNYVASQVSAELVMFCRRSGAGHVLSSDTVYRCFGDPDTGRKPDVSFVSALRLPAEKLAGGYLSLAPDVAVEVVSLNDLAEEVAEKIQEYLTHGIPEVWVISPVTRTLQIHRPNQPIAVLHGQDTLQGSGPLAGFACPLAALFPSQPPATPAAQPPATANTAP